ncbi:2-amino-4-hydroxy-6-hydroxymethyldihydropteridine diphosphokinase [Affinibrenneria salicis]|uniref:2-amino-4-hydroxy-6-hydroxymethyldihydropteridine pyrophosphokinase n=1 Tax=Affinibrenneria salicis TaxID=2590031 RepID=A0A5J5FQY7_9GAMM|nr:2-amino-4-hydroxy-6-hydroxymethyldihydropteridine diphosphokinase [Affinibrenneria salicis]KAA8995488.1 2-amino-4-hydroxy-6-hydroxymethyldihydropteridine diphosphokinase [Affinibrenneria salicis]
MARVYLALGSNLAQPLQQVRSALNALETLPQTRLSRCSSFYRSRPLGPQDQPDYLNAVVALDCALEPERLLDHTQAIELEHGRERKAHRWGPRTLDLDILLFDQQVIRTPRLTIPHYDMKNREFMLYPLAEIAPDLVFPDGERLSERLKLVEVNGLTLWDHAQPG